MRRMDDADRADSSTTGTADLHHRLQLWGPRRDRRRRAGDRRVGAWPPKKITEADDRAPSLRPRGCRTPDLMIRTSGDYRISNFLLWELAYTELLFTDTPWPEFGREELFSAIADYQERERALRWGRRGERCLMALYRDRAVVLRSWKLGEADRIVSLHTHDHGKVRGVAKGGAAHQVEVRCPPRAVEPRRGAAVSGPRRSRHDHPGGDPRSVPVAAGRSRPVRAGPRPSSRPWIRWRRNANPTVRST